MAGLDQKDIYALFPGSGMYKAGIAGTVGLAMCLFPGWQAHDARHHGRYEPDGHSRALRRQRQLHAQGWFIGYVTPRPCSLWSVGRPLMFGIMSGMDE